MPSRGGPLRVTALELVHEHSLYHSDIIYDRTAVVSNASAVR